MFRLTSLRTVAVLAALALAVPFTLAATPTLQATLDLARADAFALRASADNLTMLARNPMDYAMETHATELARARNVTDRIGKRLTTLNALREHASPAHLARIDAMESQLRRVSGELQAAIQAFGDRNGLASLHLEAYQTPVRNLYEGARALTNWTNAPGISAD